jgi:hypothetical protein
VKKRKKRVDIYRRIIFIVDFHYGSSGGVADDRLLRSARSAERGGSCLLGARGFPIAAAHPLLLSVVFLILQK